MKILYIATESSPGMLPFAVTVVNTIANTGLHDIHMIAVNTKKLSFRGRLDRRVQCTYISESTSLFGKTIDKLWFRKVIGSIKKEQKYFAPDVIHLLTADFRLGIYVLFNPLHREKFCYTVHDLHPHETAYRSLKYLLIEKIMAFGCALNRKFIPNLTTCSQHQLEELKVLYPKKNIHFTHFPTLVTDKMTNGTKCAPELENTERYILFFGTINKYKGVDLLIESYSKSEVLKHFKLVIAGKDKTHIIPKDNNIICINRYIDDEEIKSLFEKAEIVVYPYRSATMSGVLTIALFFKKKVILSDIPFFKEFECKDTIYFKSHNTKDLQDILEEAILKNESTPTECYENFYSPMVLKRDYESLYNSIIKTKK